MRTYSVSKLARLAGVSVRTLHHYDRLGLLKPSVRTETRYRLYGENELLRLQQILFYKELDFPLNEIAALLDDPDFDLLKALRHHKRALLVRRNRLTTLLETIDKTMSKLKGQQTMMTDEELYAGFTKEQAETYLRETVEKYGEETVRASENHLRQMSKQDFEQLKAEQQDIAQTLATMTHLDPASDDVQRQIARHYANIRAFWGPSVGEGDEASMYKGLAQLYVDDPRYTGGQSEANSAYVDFLQKAMNYFANTQLK